MIESDKRGQSKTEENKLSRHFESLLTRGVRSNRGIGFHGTSLEMATYIMSNGVLLPGVQDGYIYFNPRPSTVKIPDPQCVIYDTDKEALRATLDYSRVIAFDTAFLSAFDIPLGDRFSPCYSHILGSVMPDRTGGQTLFYHGLEDPRFDDIPDELRINGESRLMEEARRIGNTVRGCVISFNKKIYDDFEITESIPGDEGLRIRAPQGIHLNYFDGIEVLSSYEQSIVNDFLKSA